MRVKVMSGDGKTDLGEGEMVGRVPIYFWRYPDGNLGSIKEAEKKPSLWLRIQLRILGIKLIKQDNPKIILDSDEVVYGCQTYWAAVKEN